MSSATQSPALSTWTIDPAHSRAGFAVRHMMISTVRGSFGAVTGTLDIDDADPTRSSVRLEIDAATIDTGTEQRDAHLRSADFFDVETFPTLTFESRRIEATGQGRYRVAGDLTIRDVTREVVLDVEEEGRGTDPWGGERIGFTAVTKLDRAEFGLTWNQALEAGGVLVANEVKVTVELQVSRA